MRVYPQTIILLLILLPAIAWPQAPAPSPPKQVIDRAEEFIRADPELVRTIIRSAAAGIAAQAIAQNPAAPPPAPAPPSPPPAATPHPVVAAPPVVAEPQAVSIPAEVRDAVLSLCGFLITAAIGVALAWMRAHFQFMKEAGANRAITSSAKGLGALLEQELAKRGAALSQVSVNDPTVAAFAHKLIQSYPQWGPLVGLTEDIAARKVLGGAIEQSSVPLIPTPKSEVVALIKPVPPVPHDEPSPLFAQGSVA